MAYCKSTCMSFTSNAIGQNLFKFYRALLLFHSLIWISHDIKGAMNYIMYVNVCHKNPNGVRVNL